MLADKYPMELRTQAALALSTWSAPTATDGRSAAALVALERGQRNALIAGMVPASKS
jgi:hypothetical protein